MSSSVGIMNEFAAGITNLGPNGEVKIRKTREGKPKSRNGCKTCKIRRVKCDETKPFCQRCTRFGQKCDGYITKPTSQPSLHITTTRALAPRGLSQSPVLGRDILAQSPVSLYTPIFPSPTRTPFQTQHEQDAFQTFCAWTSHQLTPSLSDTWSRLVYQACEDCPSIRYAIVAIGTLDLKESPSGFPENQVGTLKHQFAYRQYKKSMCFLRRGIAGEVYDFRTTLVGCLLFYCFEGFNACHELAIDRVYSGLRLIRDWVSNLHIAGEKGKGQSRIRCRDSQIVGDEVLRTLGSLEIRVMSYVDGRERAVHEHYKQWGQASMDDMPEVFESLEEARSLLELIIRRSMHWLRSTMHVQEFPTSSAEISSKYANARPLYLFLDTNPGFDDRLATLKEYERWDEAFRPMLNYARSRRSTEENFLRASMLRLHWLSGYLSISSNNSRSSLVNNGRFTIELQELISIARLLLNSRSGADFDTAKHSEIGQDGSGDSGAGFVFDMQIIIPLVTVGWIYRHRTLRKEGIQLLLRSRRNEVGWDGIVVGKVMAWLAQIEEEGLNYEDHVDEYVPESVAVRGINITFDTERRLANVSCLQLVRGSPMDEEVRRETVIPW